MKTQTPRRTPVTTDNLITVERMRFLEMGPLGKRLQEIYRCSQCGAKLTGKWYIALLGALLPKRYCPTCAEKFGSR